MEGEIIVNSSFDSVISFCDSDSLGSNNAELEEIVLEDSKLAEDVFCGNEFNCCKVKGEGFKEFVAEVAAGLRVNLACGTIEELVAALQKLIKNQVECSLLELKQVVDDCYRAIQLFEGYGKRDARLHVGKTDFELKICDPDLVGKKEEICRGFNPRITQNLRDFELPKSVIELSEQFEMCMQGAFEADTLKLIPMLEPPRKSMYLSEIQNKSLQRSAIEAKLVKDDAEWQRQEAKLIKNQLKARLQALKIKEKDFDEESKRLKAERLRIMKEGIKVEKSLELLSEKREKFLKFTETLQQMVNGLLEKSDVSHINSFDSTNSFVSTENYFANDEEEQKSLESELNELERQLLKSPPNSDSLRTRINRIKTRLSSIKSERMISRTVQKSLSLKNVMSKVQNMMSIKPTLPLAPNSARYTPLSVTNPLGRRSVVTPLPFALAPSHGRSTTFSLTSPLALNINARSSVATPTTERLDLHCHQRSDGFYTKNLRNSLETEEEASYQHSRLLVVKEARLNGKEEDLNKREMWIKSTLEKQVSDKDAVEYLKNERMAINRVKREVEGKEKALESRMESLEKVEGSLRKKSEDVEKRIASVEGEKAKIDEEREEIIQKIEDIRMFVLNNI